MQTKKKLSLQLGSLATLCAIALSWGLIVPKANAQENPREQEASLAFPTTGPKSPAKRYFVEFRARSALSYGHAFLVHGKLNAQGDIGQVTPKQVAGLHPFSDSSIPWSVGHVVPVIAEHGWTDGDTEDEYITARYRVLLTEPEYNAMIAYIDRLNKKTPLWHAVAYNCEAFIGDVAKFIGLKAPPSTLVFPDTYIHTMAELNGGTPRTYPSAIAAAPASKPAATATRKPAATAVAAKPAGTAVAAKPAATPVAAKPAAASTAAKPAAPAKPAAAVKPPASSQTAAAVPAAQPERVDRY
jgi:hypothetical protein